MLSAPHRPGPSAPTDGSRTITVTDSQPRPEDEEGPSHPPVPIGVLRLRGGPRSRPQVQWTDDVVDNEGAGRKKSKICCIYHKPRPFDESSDESDSSDDDSDCGGEGHDHAHRHANPPEPSGGIADRGPPNAYEKAPAKS